jgi:hypothetical protein
MIRGIHNFQEAKGFIMQRKMASILLVGLFQFNCFGGPYEKLVADFKTPTEENRSD